jgi:hypothetical protein
MASGRTNIRELFSFSDSVHGRKKRYLGMVDDTKT